MKSAGQAWQEVSSRAESRRVRREALVQKGKSLGSGNALFLLLSIAYAAIDMEIELERSSVNISSFIDLSKVPPETLQAVAEALRKNGYDVVCNPGAALDLRFYISWGRLNPNRHGEEIGKNVR